MNVSVIIGSYRPGECLYRCIKSLNKQTILPDEIIIGLDQLYYFPTIQSAVPIIRVASDSTGVSAARNAACREATGDILAFIDDDATADPVWVEKIHKTFEERVVSCVGGSVLPVFEHKTLPRQWYWIIGCTGMSHRPICSNMAIRKSDFIECGRFPENLGRVKYNLSVGEETELILALEKAGKMVAWNPNMLVHHWCPNSRITWGYILSRAYKEGIGKAIIGKKYPLDQEQAFLKYYLAHPDPDIVCNRVGIYKR
jgi:glycosyltransferase involved in cell wall biosynthesis